VGWKTLAVGEPRSADHERFVQALCEIEPVIREVRSIARQFLGLIHRRRPREFDRWLKRLSRCRRCGNANLCDQPACRFTGGTRSFHAPVSNGQTEGHVNRLKFLKRQMYGRASVELLRLRVLNPN